LYLAGSHDTHAKPVIDSGGGHYSTHTLKQMLYTDSRLANRHCNSLGCWCTTFKSFWKLWTLNCP